MEYTLEEIRKLARESRDDGFYQAVYTNMLSLAGYRGDIGAIPGYGSSTASGDVLGEFPDIVPNQMDLGLQNHLFQDFTTNVSVVVFGEPEFVVETDDDLVQEIEESYLRERWQNDEWTGKFYRTGMDVYAGGTGLVEVGIGKDGGVSIQPVSPLDCLWDRTAGNIDDARFYMTRRRMTLDRVKAKYGEQVTPEEITKSIRSLDSLSSTGRNTTGTGGRGQVDLVYEWSFWSEGTHMTVLGDLDGGIAFAFDPDQGYVRTEEAGPNPFQCIPVVPWTDIPLPKMNRATGRVQFARPIADQLNEIEAYISNVLQRGISLTMLDTTGMEQDEIKKMREAKGAQDVAKFIMVDNPDAARSVHRVPAAEVPATVMAAREMLLRELNNSTGVQDAQRGQAFQGERKTRFEVQATMDAGGVKLRQTQKQFGNFLTRLIRTVRKIGAQYDRRVFKLRIPSMGLLDTGKFPLEPFLKDPIQIYVLESSLQFVSKDQKARDRLLMFQGRDMPLIQIGAANPQKVAMDVFEKTGVSNPQAFLNTGPPPSQAGTPGSPQLAQDTVQAGTPGETQGL